MSLRLVPREVIRNGDTKATIDAYDGQGDRPIFTDRVTADSAVSRNRYKRGLIKAMLGDYPGAEAASEIGEEVERGLLGLLTAPIQEPEPAPTPIPAQASPFTPEEEWIVEFPESLRLAEHFLDRSFRDRHNQILLRRFRKAWWGFERSGYADIEGEPIRGMIYRHLDHVWTPVRDKEGNATGEFRKLTPRVTDVREVENALVACRTLVTGDIPQWLDGRERPAVSNVVAFRNGILDTESFRQGDAQLIPPTPLWFSPICCPYDFDPNATSQLWLDTIDQIFDSDAESIALLQEYMGLLLVPDNQYEKLLLLVGRSRSGKGTIIEAVMAMLGKQQIAATTFTKLASRFGLAPLVGKLVAILADAHIARHTDAVAALEVVKNISGNDPQGIDRKGIDELSQVHMQTRFLIACNELPKLPDTAGALKPRLLLLYFPRTFAGKEDQTLKARLRAEAPGIARWALEGLIRLREQGGFTLPATSAQMVEEFERTVSPVKGFMHERCEIDPGHWIDKGQLYEAWGAWCKSRGDEPGNHSQFGQQLLAAEPTIRPARKGPIGQQFTVYHGIKLCL